VAQSFDTLRQSVNEMLASMFIKVMAPSLMTLNVSAFVVGRRW
jgi:hypothetical protein